MMIDTVAASEWLELIVGERRIEAESVLSFCLSRPDGGELPPFAAGAHVDLLVPGTRIIRQYSLCGSPDESRVYRLGVQLEPASRGGSAGVHRDLLIGCSARVSRPRNNFALVSGTEGSILVGGGIGVTPLLSMGFQLASEGRSFHLHYCTRSAARTGFHDQLSRPPFLGHVTVYEDDAPLHRRFDPARVFSECDESRHAYICGPAGFMEFVIGSAKSQGWRDSRLHMEYFTQALGAAPGGSFKIQVGHGGPIFDVPAEHSIANVLEENGIPVSLSCEQGVCGTCITGLLEGIPDHRDIYMNDAEHASNKQIAICCSRALSPKLVLDL